MRNPLRKFGLKQKDQNRYFIYNTVKFGSTDEMLSEMKALNKYSKKHGLSDKYFVWPVGGLLDNAVLVHGKEPAMYYPYFSR